MNPNNELYLIKTVLFNAQTITEALTRLDELGISYRESDMVDFFTIDRHHVQFWKARSTKCPLAVLINDEFVDYDDRKPFFAVRPEPVEVAQVPAVKTPEVNAGQHLIPEQSTVSVDKVLPIIEHVYFDKNGNITSKFYPKLSQIRNAIRHERRLKLQRAKGLSS